MAGDAGIQDNSTRLNLDTSIAVHRYLQRVALVDLEVRPGGKGPIEVGIVVGEQTLRRRISRGRIRALLDEVADRFDLCAVLGHNVLRHDLRILREIAPGCALLKLPVIDTLFLSPLGFPENPYHALVKGYKLSKSAANDPVADARQAAKVFADCWQAFVVREHECPGTLGLYRYLFAQASAASVLSDAGGISAVFAEIGGEVIGADVAATVVAKLADERACAAAVARVLGVVAAVHEEGQAHGAHTTPVESVADTSATRGELALALAYVAAWLPVAGDRSVLPQWVWRELPEVARLIREFREEPCGQADCRYCRSVHNPRAQLRRYFGFGSFRPKPAAPGGGSLQEKIVTHAMRGGSHLAVLPTGGGKSLCFQLPALVRNFCRGSLTVVLSPLQALMRDQVDNLNQRTSTRAAALYGLLTPLERSQVLRDIATGDVTILYIAPEQLRNRSFRRAVGQREIGCWVFDEAHCLSKWGHDFRPDYLYASRAICEIAEAQRVPVPPVVALTATAKREVANEIREHFMEHLGIELEVFAGGVERDNLTYWVETVADGKKRDRIRDLCNEVVVEPTGCAIVYHATRRATEEMADVLGRNGLPALHFHGGMNAADKKTAMQQFLTGERRVICATNAFGMGVDKPDVRLVVHAEMPGTLENYLQEAGRAGRDLDPARCVLLFDEADVEKQFQMIKEGEISHRDMVQVLRGLRACGRRAGRADGVEFHVTSGELLRDDEVDTSFAAGERSADTRVRTAVSWLERAGLVERNLNHATVISGKPALATLAEAEARMDDAKVFGPRRAMWAQIYGAMLDAGPDEGLSVDDLSGLPAFRQWRESQPLGQRQADRVSSQVLSELHEMCGAGLLEAGLQLSAFVSRGGAKSSRSVLDHVAKVERNMLEVLAEALPDIESGTWEPLELRALNEKLRERGLETNAEVVRQLLASLSRDDRRLDGDVYLTLRSGRSRDSVWLRLHGDFRELRDRAELRRMVAGTCLEVLLAKAGQARANQLVEFSLEDLVQAVQSDLSVRGRLGASVIDPIERVLLFLHDHGCILLQNGLNVFRAAMTLRLPPDARRKRYTQEDYGALRTHYDERTVQVHVMHRYAELGLGGNGAAAGFVRDYFEAPREQFLDRHFAGQGEKIARPIGPVAYRRIVDALDNPVQQGIVTAPVDENQLVLAGPGSGKTRFIVHRCAYLLRVKRVRRSAMLMLCFNRSTVLELRRRLKPLLGGRLGGLQIHTYDSLALRIAGRSLQSVRKRDADPDTLFESVRVEACELLEGKRTIAGLDGDELRDRLLAGYQHILVDEYQDIDESQYRIVSAIAGRTQKDKDARLAITAVGDDDQNIYSWRGSSVEFIRRFEKDYGAKRYELVENYRATRNLIATANRWIAGDQERSKSQSIRIDRKRRDDPAFLGPPVDVVRVRDAAQQTAEVADELRALSDTLNGREWNVVAVLAREWRYLTPLRVRCRELGVPARWARNEVIKPWQVRETRRLLDALSDRDEIEPSGLRAMLGTIEKDCGISVWTSYLHELGDLWLEAAGTGAMPTRAVAEFLWSVMTEDRQLAMAEHGVFLGTVHQAKGLEFDRVFLLDGGWEPRQKETTEDLRRLFYVGMTRARRELTVATFKDRERSFAASVGGPEVRVRESTALEQTAEQGLRRMTQLGLEDLFLDYAGRKPASHPIHGALRQLRVGARLQVSFEDEGWGLLVEPRSRQAVAALSQKAREVWKQRTILEAVVIAVVHRARDESSGGHGHKCRVPTWHVPLIEVVWRE